MFINWAEHYEKTRENFIFQSRLRNALKEETQDIRYLRVLDYGAGAVPYLITQFSSLQKDQRETVAFDPNLKAQKLKAIDDLKPIEWTAEPPSGDFDLVVCHFSLHHMDTDPVFVIRRLKQYRPKVISIIEYDYSKTNIGDFQETFIGEIEQRELNVFFKGDLEKCYAYHKRYNMDLYRKVLVGNGFSIVRNEQGNGIAQFKFYLIGKSK